MQLTNRKTVFLLTLLSAALCLAPPLRAHAAKATSAPNGFIRQGDDYVLYREGVRVTQTGWHEFAGEKFQVTQGCVTARMEQVHGIWKLYRHNAQSGRWEMQKSVWATASEKDYYFNQKGICTKIYNPATKKCAKYSSGKMTLTKKEACALPDGKLYLFNSKGIQITKAGWQPLSKMKVLQTAKGGRIISRMEKKNGFWRFSKYDYAQGKWTVQKKTWKTVNKKKYYFNAQGKCTRMYNISSQKCYDCKKGKMTLVKNATREINKKKYYFKPNGIKANSAGLYLTASKKLVYATANGRVTKQLPGKTMAYTLQKGKVTSCRVKDAHYIRYYNSKGALTRKINLNKKMVALTYDDGPSQYTPIILDVLEKYNSRATFFVVGDRVASYASAIKRTHALGCEIGNHTYSHSMLNSIGIPAIQSQIAMTNRVVQNITGASTTVMRPPGGGYNNIVQSAVGMPIILWSIDTLDWRTRSAPATQAAVLGSVRDGDVVLMHDLYGPTAEASKTIIPELVRRGYQLVTVSELADCRGAMANGGVYSAWHK